MKSMLSFCAAVAFMAVAAAHDATAQAPRVRTIPITPRAIALAPAKTGAPSLTVTSPDFENLGTLDKKFMQATVGGENKAPAIAWSPGPPGTQSYVLLPKARAKPAPTPPCTGSCTTSPRPPITCHKAFRPTSTLQTRRVR
jgi:hypothetical protein